MQTGSATLRLTAEQLTTLGDEVWAVIDRYRDAEPLPEARRVDLQFRGYPVVVAGRPAVDPPSSRDDAGRS